jgi:hypothetical protein
MRDIKKSELASIVAEVQQALNGATQDEANKIAKLSKAHEGEDTAPEVPKDDSATTPIKDGPGADADDSASASGPPADDSATASAAPPAADDGSGTPPAHDDGSAAPAGDPAAMDGQGGANPEELEAAYAALPLHELQMHYLAVKAALVAAMGSDGGADAGAPPAPGADAGPPPAGPDAGSAPPPAAPDLNAGPQAPTMKTEKGAEMPSDKKANGENPLDAVTKSEKDLAIEALTKTVNDQGKALDTLLGAVKKIVETPVRKSIVSTADLPRTGQTEDLASLAKSEVLARLKKVATNPTLTKSDRERINHYALGHITVDGVKDLLQTTSR